MSFSNRNFRGLQPKTFAACERLWFDHPRKIRNGRIKLGGGTYLRKEDGRFVVQFHSTDIITYFPDHKAIQTDGWYDHPTTQGRIESLTGVRMGNNAALKFHQSTRIEGYPYFDGIRVDNHGQVLEEDRRPDFKTVPVKAVVQQYTKLWRTIAKVMIGRWEIGEWKGRDGFTKAGQPPSAALQEIEALLEAGETFIPHSDFEVLISGVPADVTGFNEVVRKTRDSLRDFYYRTHAGYIDIEVVR